MPRFLHPFRLALLTAALLAALPLVGAHVASAEAVPTCQPPPSTAPADFVGVTAEDVFWNGVPYRREQLKRQAEAGFRLNRVVFSWAQIEKQPGHYDFSFHDEYVHTMAERCIAVLPILLDPPRFRSSRPKRRAKKGLYPPKRAGDFAKFAVEVVKRYGVDGSFWRERPYLVKTPIRSVQLWNEPHIQSYWASRRSPARYARLIRPAYKAIKQVDPGTEVVAAGISDSPRGIPFRRFIDGLYRARGHRWFDTVSFHPYARSVGGVIKKLRQVRNIMNRRRDRQAQLWVTEWGWADVGRKSIYTVGVKGQAARTTGFLRSISKLRRKLNLRGIVYYNWRDGHPTRGRPDYWGLHCGLLKTDGASKPSFSAHQEALKRYGFG